MTSVALYFMKIKREMTRGTEHGQESFVYPENDELWIIWQMLLDNYLILFGDQETFPIISTINQDFRNKDSFTRGLYIGWLKKN